MKLHWYLICSSTFLATYLRLSTIARPIVRTKYTAFIDYRFILFCLMTHVYAKRRKQNCLPNDSEEHSTVIINPSSSADTFLTFVYAHLDNSITLYRTMVDACRKLSVRFDENNVSVHLEEVGFDWSTIPPSSLWYTRNDYKLFQKRDDLIVSLVNGYRFYETKDHTYRGLEGNEYDRYRKSISRRVVTSEQDRQRTLGINDPQMISDVYISFCSHSAEQACVRATHDAFTAREDVYCISSAYDPTLSDDSVFELYSPQRTRDPTMRKSMNPSMISSVNTGESSRRPPSAPRSSSTVEFALNTVGQQQKSSSSLHSMIFESPRYVSEKITSNECISDDGASAIPPVGTHRHAKSVKNGRSAESLKPVSSKMDFVISPRQQSKSKSLRSISRRSSPKKPVDSVSPFKGNAKSPTHRRIAKLKKSHCLHIDLLQ